MTNEHETITAEDIDSLGDAEPVAKEPEGDSEQTAPSGVTAEAISEFERLLQKEVDTRRGREEVPLDEFGHLVPKGLDGLWRLANLYHQAAMLPKGVQTKAQVFLVISTGAAVGMDATQSLKNIMIVNNRCSIWGDGLLAVVKASGGCEYVREWMEGEGDDAVAHCETKRRGDPEPVVRSFSAADAKTAELWRKAGPWQNYPKRMLQMRARAFCLRDVYPDLLGGLAIVEEMRDIPADRPRPSRAERGPVQNDEAEALDAELSGDGDTEDTEE